MSDDERDFIDNASEDEDEPTTFKSKKTPAININYMESDDEVSDSDIEEGEMAEGEIKEKKQRKRDFENEESDQEEDENEISDEEEAEEGDDAGSEYSYGEYGFRPKKKEENIQLVDMADSDIDDDEDDDDDDEEYLKKFDESTKQNIISEFHPEMQQHNYEEVEALCKIVMDENNVIIDPLHRTLPILTKYEKARILGERAKQLNAGGKPFIEVEPNMIDGYLIALKELEQKKIPFIIKRPLPNGGCEYWKLKDLEILA